MRLTPVMLALLLALSPIAVGLQASAPTGQASVASDPAGPAASDSASPAQSDGARLGQTADTVRPARDGNTTAVLTLGTDPARSAFDSPSLSLGNALAMDRDGLQTRLSVHSLDQQLRAADTVEKKKQVLNRYRYRIENRIISLKAWERQATQAFSNGTITKSEYLRTLGQIDREAGEIRNAIDALQSRASRVPKFGFTASEAKSLKAKLVPVEGPIRNRISRAMQGRADPVRVYVGTADTGIVLSAIVDGKYVREIYRADNRDPSKSGSMRVEAAENQVVRQQYAWVINNSPGGNHWHYSALHAIRFTYYHSHGNLTAYVDTGTERIYREIQYKQLWDASPLPTGPFAYNASDNVTVVVNRTYPGGPLRVRLTNSTGAPLMGRVSVAGEPVGRTGRDGVLWTLAPAEQFRVSATHGDTTVNVTVKPIINSS